jgi:DNA-binding transcriptional MerR regulator
MMIRRNIIEIWRTDSYQINNGVYNVSENQKAFWTSDVADVLDIKPITVRTWALLFEKNGYRFIRDSNNKRAFTERDVIMLKQFKSLTMDGNMTQDNAVISVMARFHQEDNAEITLPVMANAEQEERSDPRYEALVDKLEFMQEHIERQEKFNRELLKRLDQQQDFIEKSVKERDKLLLETIHKFQETTQLQIEAAQEQSKKKWWQFGKYR